MTLHYISSSNDYDKILNVDSKNLYILHFGAEWAPQCKQINDILDQMAKDKESINTQFCYIESEKVPQITQKYKIAAVPTIVFLKRNEVLHTLKGVHPQELVKNVKQFRGDVAIEDAGSVPTDSITGTELNNTLKMLVNKCPIMLFMKGIPSVPECGFSRQIIEILNNIAGEGNYGYFNILADSDVREGLKKFSNWPTYPQLYVNGELIGGLDIVKEMQQEGELQNIIQPILKSSLNTLNERLESLVKSQHTMLFMKGTPDEPRCGFSRKTIDMLRSAKVTFGTFDILSDNEVRQGLKEYSKWPTYPQLYVDGELVGGFDIVTELHEENELAKTCGQGN